MRYHLAPIRTATVKKMRTFGEDGEEGTLLHCWCKHTLVQQLWKTVWRFIKKLKLQLPYNPAIILLDI
jgi:hypothetical protein